MTLRFVSIIIVCISGITKFALAISEPGELLELKLDSKAKVENGANGIAIATATCATFLNSKRFYYELMPSLFIVINGRNEVLEGVPVDNVVSLKGPYGLIKRGIIGTSVVVHAEAVLGSPAGVLEKQVRDLEEKLNVAELKSDGFAHVISGDWQFGTTPTKIAKDSATHFLWADFKLADATHRDVKLVPTALPSVSLFSTNDVDNVLHAILVSKRLTSISSEATAALRSELNRIIRTLGDIESIYTVVTKMKVKFLDDQSDRYDQMAVTFINKQTKEFVTILTRSAR